MSKIELDRNNKTLYGQIADILRERIMSGEFKPGDILPSERELAEEMQVSRIPSCPGSDEVSGVLRRCQANSR